MAKKIKVGDQVTIIRSKKTSTAHVIHFFNVGSIVTVTEVKGGEHQYYVEGIDSIEGNMRHQWVAVEDVSKKPDPAKAERKALEYVRGLDDAGKAEFMRKALVPKMAHRRPSLGDTVRIIADSNSHRHIIGSVHVIRTDDHDHLPYRMVGSETFVSEKDVEIVKYREE